MNASPNSSMAGMNKIPKNAKVNNAKVNEAVQAAVAEGAEVKKQANVLFQLSAAEIEALGKVQAPPKVEKAAVAAELGVKVNGAGNAAGMKGGVSFGSIKKYALTPLYYFIKLMLWPMAGLIYNLWDLFYLHTFAKTVEVNAPRLFRIIPNPVSYISEAITEKAGIPLRKVIAAFGIVFWAFIVFAQYTFFTKGELPFTGGGNGNSNSVEGFKEATTEVQEKFNSLPEEEQLNFILRILIEIEKMVPEGEEITTDTIYAVLLKKLDEWYESKTASGGGRRRKASRKNKTRKYRK